MTYGLGEKADGVFVVVDLKVRSAKSESVTLTDNVFQLEVDGKTYDPDSDGTVAAVGAGETRRAAATGPMSSRKNGFNELGFGTTHAYIELPKIR